MIGAVDDLGLAAQRANGADAPDGLCDDVAAGADELVDPPASQARRRAKHGGRMFGVGLIEQGGRHGHFAFRVAQVRNRDYGRLEYWENDARRCGRDDDYDHDRNFDGDHDQNYGRDHGKPRKYFEATSVDVVVFSDDPAFASGRGRDTFSLVVQDSQGNIVANVNGRLAAGNIQSIRLGCSRLISKDGPWSMPDHGPLFVVLSSAARKCSGHGSFALSTLSST